MKFPLSLNRLKSRSLARGVSFPRKRESSIWLLIFWLIFILGCHIVPPKPKPTRAEAISALTTVSRGLTNKPITEAQLKNLAQQTANDPQAQSALGSINTALSPQHKVKYCPVDGQRFSADMLYCPIHHVKLKWVE